MTHARYKKYRFKSCNFKHSFDSLRISSALKVDLLKKVKPSIFCKTKLNYFINRKRIGKGSVSMNYGRSQDW